MKWCWHEWNNSRLERFALKTATPRGGIRLTQNVALHWSRGFSRFHWVTTKPPEGSTPAGQQRSAQFPMPRTAPRRVKMYRNPLDCVQGHFQDSGSISKLS